MPASLITCKSEEPDRASMCLTSLVCRCTYLFESTYILFVVKNGATWLQYFLCVPAPLFCFSGLRSTMSSQCQPLMKQVAPSWLQVCKSWQTSLLPHSGSLVAKAESCGPKPLYFRCFFQHCGGPETLASNIASWSSQVLSS